jgi:flagellar biosynthesis/type III secretory pathway protein FliH
MTLPEKFIEQINKAIDDYDNGKLTRAGLSVTVREVIEKSANEAYEAGHSEGWDDGYADAENEIDPDDEIELDIDLDNIEDDEEDA